MVFAKFWPSTLLFRYHFKIHYLGWYAYGRINSWFKDRQQVSGRVRGAERCLGAAHLLGWAGAGVFANTHWSSLRQLGRRGRRTVFLWGSECLKSSAKGHFEYPPLPQDGAWNSEALSKLWN